MPIENITPRRQKQMDTADELKRVIRLWTKKWKLANSQRGNVSLVELPKPIRSGYTRKFVLRDDVARSDDARYILAILKEVQHEQFCRNKEFIAKAWNERKAKPMEHQPKPIEHKRWNELQGTYGSPFQVAKVKDMFEETWTPNRDYRGRLMRGGKYTYVFKKPWMFTQKVEPNYITHRLIINPQLESELQEMHNYITSHNLEKKLAKATSKRNAWRDDWEETKAVFLGRVLDREKNDILKTYNVKL